MLLPFMYNFQSLFIKFPTIFRDRSLIFAFYLPIKLSYFSQKNRKPKIFGFKNVMERGIIKCLTFEIHQISSKIFGKIIILKPL